MSLKHQLGYVMSVHTHLTLVWFRVGRAGLGAGHLTPAFHLFYAKFLSLLLCGVSVLS